MEPLLFQDHDLLSAFLTDSDTTEVEDGIENQCDGFLNLEYPVSNFIGTDYQRPGYSYSQCPGPNSKSLT